MQKKAFGKMMVLMFENSAGVEREIAKVNSEEEAFREIQKFLKEWNFKSYYTRTMCVNPHHKVYDVGSHTEFFHLYIDDENHN